MRPHALSIIWEGEESYIMVNKKYSFKRWTIPLEEIAQQKISDVFYRIIHIPSLNVLTLKEASVDFWKVIKMTNNFDNCLLKLADIFSVPKQKLKQDLAGFIEELFNSGFLILENTKREVNSPVWDITPSSDMEFVDYSIENHFLRSVQIELTKKCNENCIHCYIVNKHEKELVTNEWLNIIDQLTEMGCGDVVITGGELFTRKDTVEIIRYARKKLMLLDIFSNLTLLNDEEIDVISKLYVRSVQASVYSNSEEIHDRITQKKGSFKKTVHALERFKANGIQIAIKYPLMTLNYNDLDKLKDFAEKMGAILQIDPVISVKTNGDKTPLQYRLEDEQILERIVTRPDVNFLMDSEIPRGKRKIIASKIICGAGLNAIYINANGVVWPCVAFPLDLGNLQITSLRSIWQKSDALKNWRRYTWSDVKKCNVCKYAEICNFCPGISYAENGDALRANDSACRLTYLYAHKLKIKNPVSS